MINDQLELTEQLELDEEGIQKDHGHFLAITNDDTK